jgi:putative hemolysin
VWTVELLVMLVMILLNGVVAGYEIALASVSLARLEALLRETRPGAKSALSMKRNMERSLAVVQLGMTLFAAIAAATGGAGAEGEITPLLIVAGVPLGLAHVLAIGIVVVPLTVVTLVFGELAPKVFSLRNNEWVCLRLSPLMSWATRAVWPAVWVLERIVAWLMGWSERLRQRGKAATAKVEAAELQEIRAMAGLARMSQLIGARQESIIINAVRLSARTVRESMLRAEHISMLDVHSSLEVALVAAHLDLHTRFPVTERPGDPQAIIGYVNFKDIVACMRLSGHNPSLRSVVRPMPRLRADLPLSTCLEHMIHEHTHIALIRGSDDRVVGMVTLEDIIEELVGEIQDEYDRLPSHIKPSGNDWVAGGGVPLARVAELTGFDFASDPKAAGARTLSDWVVARLGRPVQGGDVVEQGRLRVIVRSVRRQRVNEAQVNYVDG